MTDGDERMGIRGNPRWSLRPGNWSQIEPAPLNGPEGSENSERRRKLVLPLVARVAEGLRRGLPTENQSTRAGKGPDALHLLGRFRQGALGKASPAEIVPYANLRRDSASDNCGWGHPKQLLPAEITDEIERAVTSEPSLRTVVFTERGAVVVPNDPRDPTEKVLLLPAGEKAESIIPNDFILHILPDAVEILRRCADELPEEGCAVAFLGDFAAERASAHERLAARRASDALGGERVVRRLLGRLGDGTLIIRRSGDHAFLILETPSHDGIIPEIIMGIPLVVV
jgi:hypothetical protein